MTFLFCGLDHKIIQEAAQRGLPVCRHLFVHYPDDEYVLTLGHQQFLVGSEILVVPVLDKGKNNVQAYFPLGESSSWQHIWTGEVYAKPGCEIKVDTPVGYPAVFVKVGSIVGETFIKNQSIQIQNSLNLRTTPHHFSKEIRTPNLTIIPYIRHALPSITVHRIKQQQYRNTSNISLVHASLRKQSLAAMGIAMLTKT